MPISQARIDRIKANVSIELVLSWFNRKVVKGRTQCIFPERHAHGDRTPSMSVFSEGRFKCWVCEDVHGDVLQLVRLALGFSFPEAVAWLEERVFPGHECVEAIISPVQSKSVPVQISPKTVDQVVQTQKVVEYFLSRLVAPMGESEKWLRNRGIFSRAIQKSGILAIQDPERAESAMVERFGKEHLSMCGFLDRSGRFTFRRHPLIFPYGQTWFQARALEPTVRPKELNCRGPIPHLFAIENLHKGDGPLFLCEGVVDALTLMQRGLRAMAVPGAGAFKKEWAHGFKGKTVFVAFDADQAGRNGAQRVCQILAEAGARCFDVNQGVDDVGHNQRRVSVFDSPAMPWGQDLNDILGKRKTPPKST